MNADGTYASLKESVAKSKRRSEEKKTISESERAIRGQITDLKAAIADANRSADEDIRVEDLKIARLKDGLLVWCSILHNNTTRDPPSAKITVACSDLGALYCDADICVKSCTLGFQMRPAGRMHA